MQVSRILSLTSGLTFTNEKFSKMSMSPIVDDLILAVSLIKSTKVLGLIPSLLPIEKNRRISPEFGASKELDV